MTTKKTFDPNCDYDIDRDWDEFEHKIVEGPEASARIQDDGTILVSVHLGAKHWIGVKEEDAHVCRAGMGICLNLKDLWMLAPKNGTPYRRCLGRHCTTFSMSSDDEVIRLYREDQIVQMCTGGEAPPPAAFACAKCRIIQPSEHLAREHCKPFICDTCGQEAVAHQTFCWPCHRKKREVKDRENFRNVKKVSYKDYDGPVHVPDASTNEGFFSNVDEYLEWLEDNLGFEGFGAIPEVVWTCRKSGLQMDAQDILENALENHHEEAGDNISNESEKELQEFLNAWCNKQGVESWDPNYDLGVELPQEILDEIQSRAERSAEENKT